MFRNIIISLVAFTLTILTTSVQAQVITVSEEVFLKNDYSYDVLGKIGGNTLLFRDQVHKFEVQAFDDEMRFKWDREIEFERNKVDIIGVLPGDDIFNVVYGFKKKGDYIIRHKTFNPAVTVQDTTTIFVYEDQYFPPNMKMAHSDDRSKAIIFRGDKESEIEVFSYDILNRKLIWNLKLKFKNIFLRRDFRKMIVSNEGDMFMILEHTKAVRNNNYFEVIAIDSRDPQVVRKEIDFEDMVAVDIFAEFDNLNQKLVLAGLFAEKKYSNADGMFFSNILMSEDHSEFHLINFSDELLADVHGKEVNKNKGLTNFNIQNMVLREDGGAIVIAEMNKEFSRRPTVPARRDYMRGGWVDYYYEDLIVFSIHPNGKEHWKTVLHKRQYSQDDDAVYSSFFLFKTPQQLRLLYNDEIRQENTISEYVIKGNGKHERNAVFSTDYQRLKLRFRDAVQVAYNECIVPSERNNRLNLVRIRYD